MRRLFLLFVFCMLSPVVAASSSFDLSRVPLRDVVSLYFKQVGQSAFVLCNDLVIDERLVSLRAGGDLLDRTALRALLRVHGYDVVDDGGVAVVCKSVAPGEVKVDQVELDSFIYRPKFRDVSFLVDLASVVVKGSFASRRSASAASVGGSGSTPLSSSMLATGEPVLVFMGTPAEVRKLESFLAAVDVPSSEVVVRAHLYEVGFNQSDGSSLDVIASVLGGSVEVSVTGALLRNSLRLKRRSFDAVASALASDGRFRVVTSPYARVSSGKSARFVVGSDVPVLGAVVVNGSGQSQQSVDYRASGTIFEVTPRVFRDSVEVDVLQQVSAFVVTETGVNASPTLNKRELRTSVAVQDGEVFVIGGLGESKNDSASSSLPFLPFALSRSSAVRESEIVLLLEVSRIPAE